MAGARASLKLFNEKPLLKELEGQPLPDSVLGDQRYAFIQANAGVLGPQFKFGKHGKSGQEISEALPHLHTIADEIYIRLSERINSIMQRLSYSLTPALANQGVLVLVLGQCMHLVRKPRSSPLP